MTPKTRVAVIGGGPAGLFAAHALATPTLGLSCFVSLFESHSKPGGCASFFKRKLGDDFVSFDAGATVLNAGNEGQFLNRFLKKLEVPAPQFNSTSEVFFFLENHTPSHFSLNICSGASYIESLAKVFPQDAAWIEKDLPKLFKFSQSLQHSFEKLPVLPLQNASDLFQNLKALDFGQALALFLNQSKTFAEWLSERQASAAFKEFVDLNFMITLQCKSEDALVPWGAMALFFYPLGIGTCEGGMKAFFEALLASLKTKADVHIKEAVSKISQQTDGWHVETSLKTYGPYDKVFSSVPRFNTEALLGKNFSPPALRFQNLQNELWTALIGYFVVSDEERFSVEAFNLHVKNKKGIEVYYSFSKRNDLLRAPRGHRCVTASTHWRLDNTFTTEKYKDEKIRIGAEFLKEPLENALSGIDIRFEEYASPKTLLRYTKRMNGTVGGIPLSKHHTLWRSAPIRTPFEGLYQIGDTSFPGQSVYACAVGALMGINLAFKNFNPKI